MSQTCSRHPKTSRQSSEKALTPAQDRLLQIPPPFPTQPPQHLLRTPQLGIHCAVLLLREFVAGEVLQREEVTQHVEDREHVEGRCGAEKPFVGNIGEGQGADVKDSGVLDVGDVFWACVSLARVMI